MPLPGSESEGSGALADLPVALPALNDEASPAAMAALREGQHQAIGRVSVGRRRSGIITAVPGVRAEAEADPPAGVLVREGRFEPELELDGRTAG
jgi:hypothetical protein